MKIIAVGDVHMTPERIRHIDGAALADLIIVNGDLTNYGSIREAKLVLEEILAINPSVLAQFGNLDQPEVNDYLEELGLNLHNQARLVNQRLCLIGIGGSNPTPFKTPSEFTETELASFARNGFEQAEEYLRLTAPAGKARVPLVLVSHTPPARTSVDRLTNGAHAGSEAIRACIETRQPELCIVGHIHEARGTDRIGTTRIINPGMVKQGGWVEISIEQGGCTAVLHD